ncbi:hypothetical protein [Mycobacterium riyadhense]|uniref:hypothetical protein n=1 Tax=Mycobacterium riyadhense TaxID=486698 RepID=UPI00195E825D|nr:hypothetical protein [Mycobacterium riyadhense]
MAVSNAQMLALARKLPIPVPWDRNVLIDNLARERGRPIRLIPTDVNAAFTDGPCGLWLIFDHEDVILHEAGTTDYHIDQIVCHEIGHMILEHDSHRGKSGAMGFAQTYGALLPDLDPSAVLAVLGRTDFASDQERDAEMFASALMLAAAEADQGQSMMRSAFFRRQ